MERKEILSTQKVKIKLWKGDFYALPCAEGIKYVYKGDMTENSYCEFLGMDYHTVRLLGVVGYVIEYNCIEGNKYILKCETYINSVMNEKLSFELEDNEDYLELYGETREGVGVARWLPSNWKELITDEQLHDILQERNIQTIECLQDNDVPDEMKERIAKDWCKENSGELEQYLDDYDKERIAKDWCKENSGELEQYLDDYDKEKIAYDYIDDNPDEVADKAFGKLSDPKDFIKNCIDNL